MQKENVVEVQYVIDKPVVYKMLMVRILELVIVLIDEISSVRV